jgi:biotin carboxyl carrier protein
MPLARYRVTVGERAFDVEVEEREGRLFAIVNGRGRAVDLAPGERGALVSALLDGESVQALVELPAHEGTVVLNGVPFEVSVQDERAARLASLAATSGAGHAAVTLKAPMPGLVVRVNAAPGASVEKGEPLVVLQAMKMENELSAPRAGTIKQVEVAAGQTVEHGQVLVVLE